MSDMPRLHAACEPQCTAATRPTLGPHCTENSVPVELNSASISASEVACGLRTARSGTVFRPLSAIRLYLPYLPIPVATFSSSRYTGTHERGYGNHRFVAHSNKKPPARYAHHPFGLVLKDSGSVGALDGDRLCLLVSASKTKRLGITQVRIRG